MGSAVVLVWIKISMWTFSLALLWWLKLEKGEYREMKYEDLAHHFLWIFHRDITVELYKKHRMNNSFAILFTGPQFSYVLPLGIYENIKTK